MDVLIKKKVYADCYIVYLYSFDAAVDYVDVTMS